MADPDLRERFGPNDWLVEEMHRRYLDDPSSVSESWQEFFADYRPMREGKPSARKAARRRDDTDDQPAQPKRRAEVADNAAPLRGAQARIAENMQASLSIPTATSVRVVAAKLLEENRRLVNDALAASARGKVSFTHLIGYAVVRALGESPAMRSSYEEVDGKPHVIRHPHVRLGLAVDMQRRDGTRTLLVPNIPRADEMEFAEFWGAYEELIRRVRSNKLAPDDFAGTTATITNPGMIGTVLSVPRLMPGQGVIVGVGSIDYPSEYRGADPSALADLGIGKVISITSTYDHRIIQGAESGEFLGRIDALLSGEDRFYDDIFESLGVPHEPVRWSRDRGWAATSSQSSANPQVEKNARVLQLINMYRVRGHLVADLNPLYNEVRSHVELEPSFYGLGVWDLDRRFITGGLGGRPEATLRDILDLLREAYCRTVGIEYMHISEPDQKQWIQERVERPRPQLDHDAKLRLLHMLNAAESFERFLHTKYVGHKRFGLEGAESLIPMLGWLLDAAAADDIAEVVMGMAHRGRLNVLSNIIGKRYEDIFREFEGHIDPDTTQGTGDVKYHLGAKGSYATASGGEVEVSLASNPSHLEAVDPVVEGIARAKQDLHGDEGKQRVLPVLIHGDAAFAGQGVVAETLNLSQLPGYKTGGTVHIVVNNGIGFTTLPEAARSSEYATDVAKMVQAPIFHVNGDDPEACVAVVSLALAFRQAFHKDVVVDLVCYRRYGHNEADEPAFTQPLLYERIEQHRSVRKLYTERLVNAGDITLQEAEAALDDFRRRLDEAFEQTRSSSPPTPAQARPHSSVPNAADVPTGVGRDILDRVVQALLEPPADFEPHPKLARQIARRAEHFASGDIDWAFAEALAMGSLVAEGRTVRLSGQDTRRGTFSQRHAVLVDHRTGREHTPLDAIPGAAGRLLVYDSLLSEYAALGFEYGYAVGDRDALVLWEAQFGDFVNGAQIIVDQYLSAAEAKWGQTSGVVLLLPHGFEGQGPEHSSARLERFLALCADDNMQVAFPTTAAQYFHLLRRQAHAPDPKPLVVLTPKSLLRHPTIRSSADDLITGRFQPVLGDPMHPDATDVRRVLLCTGKVGVDLVRRRQELKRTDAAVVRLEQLYPFPHDLVSKQLTKYANASEVVWVQEEPENMGAWAFVLARLRREVPDLQVVSRPASASPATGSLSVHQQEQETLLTKAFEDA